MNDICVYFHYNPIKKEIFYVGIGKKERPYKKGSRKKIWKNVVNKYGYEIIIAHENLTYDEASILEIKYIKEIGRKDKGLGPLVNLTDGGDGIRGIDMGKPKKKRSGRNKRKMTKEILRKKHINEMSSFLDNLEALAQKKK